MSDYAQEALQAIRLSINAFHKAELPTAIGEISNQIASLAGGPLDGGHLERSLRLDESALSAAREYLWEMDRISMERLRLQRAKDRERNE